MIQGTAFALREYFNKAPIFERINFQGDCSQGSLFEASYIQQDPLDVEYKRIGQKYLLKDDELTRLPGTTNLDLFVKHESTSPSGIFRAFVRSIPTKPWVFEIWKNETPLFKFLHKDLYKEITKDSSFVCNPLTWSADETKIMFIANENPGITSFFFHGEAGRKMFEWKEGAGDRLDSWFNFHIYVFDLTTGHWIRIKCSNEPGKNLRYIYPQFANAEGTEIIASEIDMLDVQALRFTLNKKRSLVHITGLDFSDATLPFKEIEVQTEKLSCCMDEINLYPKTSPSLSKIAYLYAPKCPNEHNVTFGFKLLDLKTKEVKELTPIVQNDDDVFTGVTGYEHNLCTYQWADEDTIVFMSCHHQAVRLYSLNVTTREVHWISKGHDILGSDSYSIAGRLPTGEIAVIRLNTLQRTHILLFKKVPGSDNFKVIKAPQDEPVGAENIIEYTITVGEVEGILQLKDIRPIDQRSDEVDLSKRPMIVYIHGGPHGIWPMLYNEQNAFLLDRGFSILNINYSGSSGRGDKFMKKLLGNCGELEVKEMQAFIQHMIDEKKCDADQLHIISASYGGLITFWLLHYMPNTFKTVSTFNPVLNILHKFYQSDVPDWTYSEVLGKETPYSPLDELTDEEHLKIKRRSPGLANHTFKSKVIIFLGGKDQRVPPAPAKFFYRKCRAQGLDVTLVEYPDEEHVFFIVAPIFDYFLRTVEMITA